MHTYGVTNTTQIKEVAQKVSNTNKTDYCIVAQEFKNRGYIIVTSEKEYYNRIDKRNKIEYICPKPSDKGILTIAWDNFINQNCGCIYCGYEAIGLIKKKHTISNIRQMFKDEGYTLISKTYINNAEKLEYICPKHGIKSISLGHFLNGKRCKECQRERISGEQRYTIDDVTRIIHTYDSEIKIINVDYKGYNNNSITLICKDCGKEFKTRLPFILHGKVRCDHCSNAQSSSEYHTEDYFINQNINYDNQVSFDECRYINRLSFDFGIYDIDDNLIFLTELDGQQHFKPTRFRGMTEEESIKQFEENQIRDKIKDEYCKQNSIPLLRIPYWDFDRIEEILTKELQKYDLITNT